jgi:hypothetical protein
LYFAEGAWPLATASRLAASTGACARIAAAVLEVGRLLDDVRRLSERAGKLETHFRQAQEDVGGILTSAERIEKRGTRIGALDFNDKPPEVAPVVAADIPQLPLKRQTG